MVFGLVYEKALLCVLLLSQSITQLKAELTGSVRYKDKQGAYIPIV